MDGEDIFYGIGMARFYRQPNFVMPGQSCYVNVGNENLGNWMSKIEEKKFYLTLFILWKELFSLPRYIDVFLFCHSIIPPSPDIIF